MQKIHETQSESQEKINFEPELSSPYLE
ncbi:uncharacterized protein METZ01_LOCUS132372 [marine metagenome]|uniref:Uncharacterized protein n=1 Tax=marine metagenome TaxID=408172 RepID=A0A381YR72_9ZZZZ